MPIEYNTGNELDWKRPKRTLIKTAKIVGIVLLCLLLIDVAVSHYMYSSWGAIPTRGAKYPPAHIKNIVWPTISCPEFANPGGALDAEVDLREVDGKIPQPVPQNDDKCAIFSD